MKAVQIKMARAALGWGVRELAEKAGVTANTVTRIENGADAKQSTIEAMQKVMEAAGVIFIPANGEDVGVRLRRTPFKHDVSHLHALWRREGDNALAMVTSGISVEEVPDGLACVGQGEELGRVSMVAGVMTISPPLPHKPHNPDRLTHTELRTWLIEATGRLRKAPPANG